MIGKYFRVSTNTRIREYQDGSLTVITNELEQCGSFYYFSKFKNAVKAAEEYESGISIVLYPKGEVSTQDEFYESQ